MKRGLKELNVSTKRYDIIDKRLKNMEVMAKALASRNEELAKNKKYIRIRGESYRAVSLSDEAPLCGYSKNGAKKLDTILGHFKKDAPKPIEGSKKERRIQNHIIKEALRHGRSLKYAMGLKKVEELLFALDEVSLGDRKHTPIIRCDILAVGCFNGDWVPVLIELKYAREKTVLLGQLDAFCKEMKAHKTAFIKLLEACTGEKLAKDKIIRKMVIWPKVNDKERYDTLDAFKGKDISVIEYSMEPVIVFEER